MKDFSETFGPGQRSNQSDRRGRRRRKRQLDIKFDRIAGNISNKPCSDTGIEKPGLEDFALFGAVYFDYVFCAAPGQDGMMFTGKIFFEKEYEVHDMDLRPLSAAAIVAGSAYEISEPAGRPRARTVVLTLVSFRNSEI